MTIHTVLFVDDEDNILQALRRGMIGEPYLCKFASSGEVALRYFQEYEISVIVTDMRMPKMNGLELLKIIKEKYPDTVKIVLTGYTHLPQIMATINQVDIFKFITKPWDMENEFLEMIRQATEYYEFLQEKKRATESLKKQNSSYQNMLHSITKKKKQIELDKHYLQSITEAYIHATVCYCSFDIFAIFYKHYLSHKLVNNDNCNINELRQLLLELFSQKCFLERIDFHWNIDENGQLTSSSQNAYRMIVTVIDIFIKFHNLKLVRLEFSINQEKLYRYIECSIEILDKTDMSYPENIAATMEIITEIARKEHMLINKWDDGFMIKI